ncbi:MAG TPA: SRPBCC domain-containing protein [Propionibacteriaceae bacterium]
MDLNHHFTLPASPDEAWNAFAHLGRLAPCFPGATVTSAHGDSFVGSVKIKLGPLALVYHGTGRYLDRDQAAGRIVIEATGADKRGNGTATAVLTVTLTGVGDKTEVDVATELTLTGKPAAFGRGVVADVTDRLVDQFVDCISPRFADGLGGPEPEHEVELGEVPGDIEDQDPLTPEAATHPEPTGTRPEPVGGTRPEPVEGHATTRPEPVEGHATTRPEPVEGPEGVARSQPKPQPTPQPKAYTYSPPQNSAKPDFQVVSTLVPPLFKRFWPWLAGFVFLALVAARTVRSARR